MVKTTQFTILRYNTPHMAKDSQKTAPKTTSKSAAIHDHAGHIHEDSLIAPNTILTIIIPQEEANAAYKKARNKMSGKVKSDGFRKGKTPPRLAESMVGPESIMQQALEMLVPERYTAEVKKQNVKPVTQPEFSVKEIGIDKDWVIEAHVAEKPVVDAKNYVSVAKSGKKKGEVEAKKQVEDIKKKQAEAKKEGKQVTDFKDEDYEAYQKDIVLQHIYQELVVQIKPKVAELLVKEETKHDLQQLAQQLKNHNVSIEDYLKQQGVTFDQLSQQLTTTALGKLQLLFVTDAIATEANIEITEKDIDESFDKVQNDPTLQQYRNHSYYRGLIKQTILKEKVAKLLLK